MAAVKKATKKQMEARVGRAYKAVGDGIQVDVWDLSKIFKVGVAAIEAGDDDDALKAKIAALLQEIRKN